MKYYTWIKSVSLFITASLLIACSDPGFDPLTKQDVILAFGDSLTEGVGTDRTSSYPAVLEELTGLGVINAGVSGEVTSEGLARFEKTLEDYQPSLVILLEGGNDILRNIPSQQTKKNLAGMIEIAQSHNIQVLLVGVPQKKLFSATASFYHELAEEYQIPLEAELVSDLLRSPQYKSDQIHFNTQGYRKLATGLLLRLKTEGALNSQ